MQTTDIKRGDIFYADLSPVIGSEQGGMRPVLIIQNDVGNHYSPTVIVAAITARISKPKMPTHIGITAKQAGVEKNSVILLEQVRTIDKQRLQDRVTHLVAKKMNEVDNALSLSLGLSSK
ncbi:PemK family transcriptional regulator [Lactobacillus sp. S2-2]|uniref:type II toxin-antitoxin system PemK/MazF family toxin n=1 Tax=Lactobacillus sp. S2-2 TaxID=2692917 RepID=UPI001F1C2833|nr:type II toxin-antitoxin system PemK/MazF family toxin [Lactobacillus sp. S2-2]MCF6515871.1 PemK family transcriptional regulator [Lactobacillus sp. S2-2]